PRELPASSQTCELCHSSARFGGERIHHVREYADNEKNAVTETKIKVDLRKVHTHMEKGIEFAATDKSRQTIPYVRMKDGREYRVAGATAGPTRRMECTDCHNRPSHGVAATPDRAVNEAIAAGAIP